MSNGPLNGPAPPGANWVDLVSRTIAQVGFPAVVAGVLLWFLLNKFQGNMDMITSRMEHNANAVEDFVTQLKGQTDELKIQTKELQLQTGIMSKEVESLYKVAEDAEALVNLRRSEMEMLRLQGKGPQ